MSDPVTLAEFFVYNAFLPGHTLGMVGLCQDKGRLLTEGIKPDARHFEIPAVMNVSPLKPRRSFQRSPGQTFHKHGFMDMIYCFSVV